MDEHRDPQTDAPDEGELLAAYLDADTDDLTAARLERRLQQDPQAAARLDALARTRARLQRLDDVEPPEGFHERLQARLAAERADGQQTDRPRRPWFAPLTAAAALVLVAVVGVAALLGQPGGDQNDSGEAALRDEPGAAAEAPMAQEEDEAAGDGAEEAEQQAAGGEEAPATAGSSSIRAVPRITGDAKLAQRLKRLAQTSEDPYSREFEVRERTGLPTAPMCVSGINETAADLVEFNERLVVAALINGDDGPQVVVFDAQSCERLRTFAAE